VGATIIRAVQDVVSVAVYTAMSALVASKLPTKLNLGYYAVAGLRSVFTEKVTVAIHLRVALWNVPDSFASWALDTHTCHLLILVRKKRGRV
jgi:hypothetical protein